jgi:hypothetical protein
VLANTRPASAPLNPPAMTIARTLAETKPSTRDKSYLLRLAWCHNLPPTTAIQLVSSISLDLSLVRGPSSSALRPMRSMRIWHLPLSTVTASEFSSDRASAP